MTFHILNTGATALTAAQRAVEVAAHNAANSTVPGYTRQRVALAATVAAEGTPGVPGTGHRGTGVQVISIDRLRDVLADLAVRTEASTYGAAAGRAEVLGRAQTVLGEYGSGLPANLSALWAAFDQLALTPNEPAARQIVVDVAGTFAEGLREAAVQVEQIRADVVQRARASTTEVNDLTREIANLNKHIVSARNGGQAPNDLMDRRDLLLDRLSELAGAAVQYRADGSVDVLSGGALLVQGPDSFTLTESVAGGDLVLRLAGRPVAVGGYLGGQIAVLKVDLRDVKDALDRVARDVGEAVNAVHEEGYVAPGTRGGTFFLGTDDAAGFRVDPALADLRLVAAAGSAAGSLFDGENALRLARLRQLKGDDIEALLGAGRGAETLGERLNLVVSMLGSRTAAALAAAETADVAVSSLREQRASANGVSLDEEMVELVKYQHAYDAAARVVSIADAMLDTLINRMGAGR